MWRRVVIAAPLTAAAYWAGGYASAARCYFPGWAGTLGRDLIPSAYSSESFGHYAVWLVIALGWGLAWTAFGLWLYRDRGNVLWLIVPLIVFLASGVEALRMDYACNIM